MVSFQFKESVLAPFSIHYLPTTHHNDPSKEEGLEGPTPMRIPMGGKAPQIEYLCGL